MNGVFLIAVEVSTPIQREQVQDLVKRNAETWWHGLPDLWLVTGGDVQEWRMRVAPMFPTTESGSMLVLKVDTTSNPGDGPRWAYRSGTFGDTASEWFQQSFGGGARVQVDDDDDDAGSSSASA